MLPLWIGIIRILPKLMCLGDEKISTVTKKGNHMIHLKRMKQEMKS